MKINVRWDLFSSENRLESEQYAITQGWADRKVQLRKSPKSDGHIEYSVEPFDNCGCPQIIPYSDRLTGRS